MSENAGAGAAPGYTCRYCRLSSDASGPACPNCGAPVDVGELRDNEGWVERGTRAPAPIVLAAGAVAPRSRRGGAPGHRGGETALQGPHP
jgi:hypothetical protein